MSRIAPRIHTDSVRVAALEDLLPQLDGGARVQLTLTDGRQVVGKVAVRPTVQQYRDEQGDEGTNGQLRLDELDADEHPHWIWLDEIVEVRQLPPTT